MIGSPYSALEPINASEMMYTSLNAGRQSLLSPFIQSSYESLLFNTYFHPYAPSIQTYIQYMQMDGQCHLSPLSSNPCTVLSFIIQLINKRKVHVHVRTHKSACGSLLLFLSPSHLPTISIVLVDRGHFCISGQLRQIQKDIRATPLPYPVSQ